MTNLMRIFATTLLATTALLLTACGGAETCDEPEFYEAAVPGKRIDVPDDLSSLAASREQVIPEASPRPPRPRDGGCLDRPPSLRIVSGEEASEDDNEEE